MKPSLAATAGPVQGRERDEAVAFLRREGYTSAVSPADHVFVATVGGELAGVVRLSTEHGVLVLRGMRVRSDLQRQGIGSQLLIRLTEAIGGDLCYCIPRGWLQSFYGSVGFEEVAESGAPPFLAERLQHYRQKGLDVVIMRRLPS
jgi:predicted N-acetyltransferase YhbS